MNKNIIIGFLILLLVSLGYYGFYKKEKGSLSKNVTQTTAKDEAGNYFVQNQDCLRYKDEIAKKLETHDSPFGEASLEQIFYSPKQGSCLYVEYTIKFSFYNRRLFDILNDGNNVKPLEMCSSLYPSEEEISAYKKGYGGLTLYYETLKACDNFDEKISRYKQ